MVTARFATGWSGRHLLQCDDSEVQEKLASMFKVDRDPVPHDRLHLAYAPFGPVRVCDPHSWFDTVHQQASFRAPREVFLTLITYAGNARSLELK